jgi:hypothetical protein
MKIAVASHIALDTIQDMKGRITESLGGPACYCSLTAREFKFKVEIVLISKILTLLTALQQDFELF